MTITSRALSAEHHTTLNMTSSVNRTSYTTCITFGCLCFSRGRNVVCCRNRWLQHVGLRVGALTRGQIDGSRSTQNDNNPISATPDFHTSFYWFVETHRTMCNTRFTNETRRVNWVTISIITTTWFSRTNKPTDIAYFAKLRAKAQLHVFTSSCCMMT